MVRQPPPGERTRQEHMPVPILVVETFSPYTRRRDSDVKYDFDTKHGIAEYWMIDPERRTITVAGMGEEDRIVADAFDWHPGRTSEPLRVECQEVLG